MQAGFLIACVNNLLGSQLIFYLYDKFIRNILPEISGFKIIDEAQVAKLNADTLVVVASRDYFDEIYAEAKNLGFNDIR